MNVDWSRLSKRHCYFFYDIIGFPINVPHWAGTVQTVFHFSSLNLSSSLSNRRWNFLDNQLDIKTISYLLTTAGRIRVQNKFLGNISYSNCTPEFKIEINKIVTEV